MSDDEGRQATMSTAMVEAIATEMRDNDEVFYMGEDVADYGGIFDSTDGLLSEFGHDRIMDVPISETAYIGAAVGAAQEGMRPIAELMFVDFFGVCMDQLYNQMAKNTYMSGANVSVPMVLTTAVGAGLTGDDILDATAPDPSAAPPVAITAGRARRPRPDPGLSPPARRRVPSRHHPRPRRCWRRSP